MVNLSGSRWAPASHRATANNNHTNNNLNLYGSLSTHSSIQTHQPNGQPSALPSPIPNQQQQQQQQLSKPQRDLLARHTNALKFTKLSRRLKWKSRALLFSHHRALNERQQNVVGGVAFPMDDREAETMFKIDFFEFYVLLERVLVHLLGVFGMVVSAAYGVGELKPDGDGLRNGDEGPKSLREELMERGGLVGDSRTFHGYAHRFHANVLAALDLPSNPLHGILGTGLVRDYLGIAKEFRNRWKDVEERPAGQVEDGLAGSRYEKMLNDLKLDEMLGSILVALEHVRPMAETELNRFASNVSKSGFFQEAMMEVDEAVGDAPWEAMPDAMDWD